MQPGAHGHQWACQKVLQATLRSRFLNRPLLVLAVRLGLLEKVRLRNQEHLPDSFWQALEARITQYSRVHRLCNVPFICALV